MYSGAAGLCGFPTSTYKVVDFRSGYTFALRRIDNARVDMDTCARVLSAWRRVRHPNVIPLSGDASVQNRALFLVHDYFRRKDVEAGDCGAWALAPIRRAHHFLHRYSAADGDSLIQRQT